MKYFLLKAYEGGSKVITNGSGGKFLADDGTYKTIDVSGSGLTTEQTDAINHVLLDYNNGKVMSDENFTTTLKNKLDSLNGERDLEMQVNTTNLQWRYVGDTVWNNLTSLDELRGFTVNIGETGQVLTKKSNTSGDWAFRQLTNADVGLGNVQNVDTTNIDNINESATKKIMTDTERTKLSNAFIKSTDTTDSLIEGLTKLLLTTSERDKLNNLSGVNTGDQDLSGLVQKTTTINGNQLSSNVEIPLIDTIVSEGTGTSILRTKTGNTQNIKGISGNGSITIIDDAVNKDIKVAVNEAGLLYDNIPDGTSYKKISIGKFDEITHINRIALDSVSGINTGDETTATIISKIGYAPADNSNVVKLNGTQDIYGVKAFKNDAIFENITVKNIIQDGTSYESHLEQLYTEKDEIILRDKAVSALSSGVYAGLRFKKYDGTNDGLLVVGNAGVARVGDVGNTQAIATREDSPVNGKVPIWNSTTMRFETANSPTTIAGYGITDGALQGTAYSNLENNVKIVQGVPAGGKMYLGATTQTGAIKIKLPKNKTNTMFKFHVRINGYSTGGKQSNSEYVVKGYNDILGFGNTADTIATCQVTVIKDNPSTMNPVFYFCTGETEDYLIIGKTTDTHVYKTVIVDNVETHFNGIANNWSKDWTISLVTTLETLTSQYKVPVIPSLNATHLEGYQSTETGESSKVARFTSGGFLNGMFQTIKEYTFSILTKKVRYSSTYLNGLTLTTGTGINTYGTAYDTGLVVNDLNFRVMFEGILQANQSGGAQGLSPTILEFTKVNNEITFDGFTIKVDVANNNLTLSLKHSSIASGGQMLFAGVLKVVNTAGTGTSDSYYIFSNGLSFFKQLVTNLITATKAIIKSTDTTALAVQNATGTSVFTVDTQNQVATGSAISTTGGSNKLIKTDFNGNLTMSTGYIGISRGTNVESAATITPTSKIFHVTGTTAIVTINIPYTGFNGSITIIPDDIFTTTTAGNIALASTAVVGRALIMTYDATIAKWYPSY